ncbi:MAG: fumarylacetoacetate hydrolase family protein [Acuticoccus sp.]
MGALRGERTVGRKIGFTNRTIWERYGVDGPMWSDVTDRTLLQIADGPVSLAGLSQPRLEPEVAVCLAHSPTPGMSDETLIGCIAWFAPAFEIVQSIYPDWRFTLADCIAANALHARLLVGTPAEPGPWALELPQMEVTLRHGEEAVDKGVGANVLDGPLAALRFLVEMRATEGAVLAPGEIISTGTITDAWPIAPGETWTADYGDTPLSTITAEFAA